MRYDYIYYPAVQDVTACQREALAAVAVKGVRVGKGAQSGVTGGGITANSSGCRKSRRTFAKTRY